MYFLRINVVFLISLFPTLCTGQFGGECIGSLLSDDDDFRNCTYAILPVIQQSLAVENNWNLLLKNLCGEDARTYLDCFLSFTPRCPDDFEGFISSLGINAADFFEFGGFDLPCSIIVGECTSVKECIPQIRIESFIQDGGGLGELISGQTATNMTEMQSNFTTPLTEFYGLLKHLCGFMKLEYDCAMTEFGKCADSIEETLDRQVPLFVVDILIADSHMNFSVLGEDIISLLENDCPSMDVQLMTNSCSLAGLDTEKFMNCYDNAMLAYENDKNGCILENALKYCTQRYIGNTCNPGATTYLVQQIPLFLRINDMECLVITTTPSTTTEQPLATSQPFTVIRPSGPATNGSTVNELASNGNVMATTGNVMATNGNVMATNGNVMTTNVNVMANNGNGNVNPTVASQNSNVASSSRFQALNMLQAITLFFVIRSM